ncbi:MAG: peptidylprolyl isomerase [Bacteroidetes bacterium]|nr:peptidylprolyl isomerase [Bacteroidota bacterium]MCL5739188.1 peptidylprolyl isomerase [Bacteroidota bacterium]
MPIMSKMRDNMPAILVGLAVLFVAMIVFEWGMNITGRQGRQYESNIVGKVNGQEITYPEFEKVYQNAVDNYKASTKQDPNDQAIAQLRNQVWDGLVNQILIKQAAKRLGIIVTDQEIVDWVTNSPETLPDVIRKNFEDSTGQVNRQILQAALASNRPEVQQFWKNVQDYLKEQLLQDKLTSRLYSAVRIPEGELRMQFAQQNEKLNTGYVLFQPALLYPDSGIHVTESEMRDYYSAHQEDYRTQSTRRLKFILLPLRPSAGDSSDVQSEINRVASLARSGTDFLELVKEYSETPYEDKFISHGQLEPSVETKAFSGKKGDIIGPFVASDGYHLIKIMDEQNGKNEYIHAAHILIHVPPGPDSTAAYKLADNILKQARSGADFAALAKQYSQDPGSAQLGGDLGWFGKGMMVKPFEDAAFKARVGQVVGPVRTQFGLHIIKVLGKDSRELKIADIKMSIKVSQQTKDDLKQRAEDFIYLAKQDGFDKAANTADVNVNQTPAFTKGKIIPGLGNYEDVVKWAFDGKLGDISEVMTLNQGYAVFMISEIKDASVTPFDQVAFQIKNLLTRKKQFDMAQTYANQLRQKLSPSDSLSKLPQFDSGLRYSVTGPFSPATFVPGVGRDFNFMAEAAKLNVGQISQAVKGNMGVFIIQLLSKTPFDTTAYKIQRMTMMQQLMQQEKSNVITNWLSGLKEKASIEDNRAKIFR